jgi:hypothetical protein
MGFTPGSPTQLILHHPEAVDKLTDYLPVVEGFTGVDGE